MPKTTISGLAKNGRAKVKLDPKFARLLLSSVTQTIKIDTPKHGVLGVKIEHIATDVYHLRFHRDDAPVEEDIEYVFNLDVVAAPKGRQILVEDLDLPPKPVTTYVIRVTGSTAIIDFGYFLPGFTFDMVPDNSIAPHTRLSMSMELLVKLYLSLHETFEKNPRIKEMGMAMAEATESDKE